MANKFQIKRTSTSGVTPNTTNASNTAYIAPGELAINMADSKLFTANGSGGLLELGSNVTNLSVTSSAVITSNTSGPALRVTQEGTGNAIVVEDSTNPDSSPFVVSANGWTVIGANTPSNVLQVVVPNSASLGQGIEVTTSANGYFRLASGASGGFLPAFGGQSTLSSTAYGMLFTGRSANNTSTAEPNILFSARYNDGTTTGTNLGTNQLAFQFSNFVTPLMTIAANGNIGIGNTAPASKLVVAGTSLISGNAAFSANVTVSGTAILNAVSANGSLGTSGQVLSSNGTAVYWAPSGGGLGAGDGLTSNATHYAILANTGIIANSTGTFVNSAYIGTLSANNTTYVNGKTEGNLNVNSASTATTANNATYAYGKTENNLNVNSAGTATIANNASYLGGTAAASYQLNSTLAANVATMTANNATYAFGKSEAGLNVNSAVNATTANNATYAFGKTEINLNVNNATTATTANNATYAFGKTEGAINANSALTANNSTNLNGQAASFYAANSQLVNYALLSGATFTGAVSGITTLGAGNTTITGFANVINGNIQLSNGYDIVSGDNFAIYDSSGSRDRFSFSTSSFYDTRSGGLHHFKIAGTSVANLTGNTIIFSPTIGTLSSTDDALEVYPTQLASSHEVRNFVRLQDMYNAGVNGQTFYIKSLTNGAHYGGWMLNSTWGSPIRMGASANGSVEANNIPSTYMQVSPTSLSTVGLTFSTGNTTITGTANITTSVNSAAFTVGTAFVANATQVTLGSGYGFSANGSLGSAGQVLHSNGTSVYWAADDNTDTTYDLVSVANTVANAGRLRLTASTLANDDVFFVGTGTTTVSSNATQITINSADQFTGTVTSVASGNGLTGGPITTTGTLSVVANSGLISNSTGVFVNANTELTANSTGVFHNDIARSNTTNGNTSPNYGGTFTAVDSITTNARGHVTAVNTKTVTMPSSNNTTYDLAAAANTVANEGRINLTGSDSTTDTVKVIGLDEIVVSSNTTAVYVDHGDVARTNNTSTASPASGGTFTAIDSITTNARGHVTEINTKTVTLPVDPNTTYDLATAANTVANEGLINLVGSNSTTDTGKVIGLDEIVVSSNTTAIYVDHGDVARTNNTSSAAPASGGTFTAVDSITTNARGHVTAINTKTVTLPVDPDTNTTYDLLAVANTVANQGIIRLKDSSNANDNVTIVGAGTTTLSSNATHVIVSSADQYTGTVTSVGSGNGLTGGAITTTGTLSVVANSGLIANSTGVFVNPNTGIIANSTGVFVNSSYIATLSANNADYLDGQHGAYYTNATNITTGTLPEAQLPFRMNQNVRTTDSVVFGSLTLNGNLVVGGTTTTVSAQNLAVTDNMIYMNQGVEATITGLTANGTAIVFTANNNYQAGWDVEVTGVNPSGYNATYSNITAANSTTFTVASATTGAYVSGGTARGKTDSNPDIGFAAGYNDGTYRHAGFFRDADDDYFKPFIGYTPEPDASPFINTSNNTFTLAGMHTANVRIGNTTVYATLNSTAYSGSANNTTYLNGQLASFYAANSLLANYAPLAGATFSGGVTMNANLTMGAADHIVLSSTSGISANGTYGTDGHVLHSNGTAVYWAADDQGVTSIATANGLSGGTITSTGTIGVTTGSTLTVNTTGIHVNSNLSVTDLTLTGNIVAGPRATLKFANTSAGGIPTIYTEAANGTAASPTQTTTGAVLFSIQPNAYTGSAYTGGAKIEAVATENIQALSRGTKWVFNAISAGGFTTSPMEWDGSNLTLNTVNVATQTYASNASNLSSGTVAFARLPALYIGTTAIQSTSAAQAVSGITTLAAGNTTITGFVNASASVNSAILSVGTSFIANTTGAYHTGTVNAAVVSVGTSFIANTTGAYHTGTMNAASFTTTNFRANTTGAYPASNTAGNALGNTIARWALSATTGDFAGAVSGITTLGAGNTTITGDLSVTGNTTLGNAATDGITINANTITIAANASIDAGTLYIDSLNNRVGIGNTTPGYMLDVGGQAVGTPSVRVFGPSSDNNWGGRLKFASHDDSAANGSIYTSINGMFFDFGGSERIRIASNGNLGIGNNAPSYRLSLNAPTQDAVRLYSTGANTRLVLANDQDVNEIRSSSGRLGLYHNVGGTMTEGLSLLTNGNVGIGTTSPGYKLEVNGSFAATTKSFLIKHPTKDGMLLRYGSLEGPENGVYVRGRLKDSNVIELPDYWTGLVDEDTITVNLTAIGKSQDLWVEAIADNKVIIGGENVNCFYTVFAERKDVEKLEVEF